MKFEDGFGPRVMAVMRPYFDMLLGDKPKLNLDDNDESKHAYDLGSDEEAVVD